MKNHRRDQRVQVPVKTLENIVLPLLAALSSSNGWMIMGGVSLASVALYLAGERPSELTVIRMAWPFHRTLPLP